MSVVLQFSDDEEAKALPILLRHSPGAVVAPRTYVVDDALRGILRESGIEFREIPPVLNLPYPEGVQVGERV